MKPIKVCCIQDEAEAKLAIEMGATALGLVSEMPSGWGPIPVEDIGRIVATIPPFVSSVLLTSKPTAEDIIAQQRIARCNAIQIVDAFPLDGYAELRRALPGVTLLQAVHVIDDTSIEKAKSIAPLVDGIILDTGSPHGATKVLGGTGLTHDWNVSKRIVQHIDTPVFLAGGLKAHNVAEAIQTTHPYGIDLCTGVRTNNRLDRAKLSAFFAAVATIW
jgi:phosphoribosylanthranilate isomerase